MAITFGILLYFQVTYLERMVKMRHEQFSENVMRAIQGVASMLERQETMFYLEQDAMALNAPMETEDNYQQSSSSGALFPNENFATEANLQARYRRLQQMLRNKYRYQQTLLNEVIINIMQESSRRPVTQRADSTMVRQYLGVEFANRGLNLPFAFAVCHMDGRIIYTSGDFHNGDTKEIYEAKLFPNSDINYRLMVTFPTENSYIFRSVRFIIPALAFTIILLVVFLFTIILAFRQKKLSEMKNDFINNMTHEFKTPISTISLASQMLADPAVTKTPAMLNQCSKIIKEETKRLRMLVERVLVLSMFDNSKISINISIVDANALITNVVQNFKIKTEKFGGSIECLLEAPTAMVEVDVMHFTNVIYSLLDNALKYSKEDVPPHLVVKTSDSPSGNELEIRIIDNGIGIRKEDQKRIFERFYRIGTGNRHDVKGFGIGLAYVREVILQTGGSIYVESEPGEGTTFCIRLPLASDAEQKESNSSNV